MEKRQWNWMNELPCHGLPIWIGRLAFCIYFAFQSVPVFESNPTGIGSYFNIGFANAFVGLALAVGRGCPVHGTRGSQGDSPGLSSESTLCTVK